MTIASQHHPHQPELVAQDVCPGATDQLVLGRERLHKPGGGRAARCWTGSQRRTAVRRVQRACEIGYRMAGGFLKAFRVEVTPGWPNSADWLWVTAPSADRCEPGRCSSFFSITRMDWMRCRCGAVRCERNEAKRTTAGPLQLNQKTGGFKNSLVPPPPAF